MIDQSLTASFSRSSKSGTTGLIMEQASWDGAGLVTKMNLIKEITNRIYGSADPNEIDCGMDGSDYLSSLYIYLFDEATAFTLGVTHGELGEEEVIQTVTVKESVHFSYEKDLTKNVKYPVLEWLNTEWGADTCGPGGVEIPAPSISTKGRDVTVGSRVYGSVLTEYTTLRHAFTLRIPPREQTSINVYDSYAWVYWDGGNDLKKLEPPPGAEDNYASGQTCDFRKIWNIRPPDDPEEPPVANPKDKTVKIDYCTQLVK